MTSTPNAPDSPARRCGLVHDPLPNRLCATCGELAVSVVPGEPYDYPAARRELETVHAFIREHGLDQACDGQWGRTTGYYEPEWDETGSTVDALRQIMEWEGYGSYLEGVADTTASRAALERVCAAISAFDGLDLDAQTARALAEAVLAAAADVTNRDPRQAAAGHA